MKRDWQFTESNLQSFLRRCAPPKSHNTLAPMSYHPCLCVVTGVPPRRRHQPPRLPGLVRPGAGKQEKEEVHVRPHACACLVKRCGDLLPRLLCLFPFLTLLSTHKPTHRRTSCCRCTSTPSTTTARPPLCGACASSCQPTLLALVLLLPSINPTPPLSSNRLSHPLPTPTNQPIENQPLRRPHVVRPGRVLRAAGPQVRGPAVLRARRL